MPVKGKIRTLKYVVKSESLDIQQKVELNKVIETLANQDLVCCLKQVQIKSKREMNI